MDRTETFFLEIMNYIDVEHTTSVSSDGNSKENIFTSRIIEDLGSGNSPIVRGLQNEAFRYENSATMSKINGYYIDEVENSIWAYVTLFNASKQISPVNQPEVLATLNKLHSFLKRAIETPQALMDSLGEDHAAYSLVYFIANNIANLDSVNYVFLTNGVVREIKSPSYKLGPKKVNVSLFDIERYRRFMDGQKIVQIDANMDILKHPIPCSFASTEKGKYDTYCCILSGNVIYRLFDTYHYQLLNSNVRTYLQLRGSVNQGIMQTIQDNPERFLAYNNGISATASEVITDFKKDIVCIKDFQIVNGGQTSASIYNAKANKGLSIDEIWVLTKITVIKDEKNRSEIVKNISRYANTQNAIKFSDFSSNDVYNIKLRELSRNIATPSINNKLQTKWYYESIAGTYNIERSDRGPSFDKEFPKSQYFKATDMATYELAYQGLPHDACKGAQDAYRVFVMNMPDLKIPDEKTFKQLVAKKILFDTTLDLIDQMIGGQGKRHMTTYVVAYFSNIVCEQKLNLDEIWQKQRVGTTAFNSLKKLIGPIHKYIKDNADLNKKSIEMYCRQPATWQIFKTLRFDGGDVSDIATSSKFVPVLSDKLIKPELANILVKTTSDQWMRMIDFVYLISDGNPQKENKNRSMCKTMKDTDVKTLSERQIAYALNILYAFYKSNKYRFDDALYSYLTENINSLEVVSKIRNTRFSPNKYFS